MYSFTGLLILLLACSLQARELDRQVLDLAKRFSLAPLKQIEDKSPQLTQLGRELFKDPILSGRQNISCQTCHHPRFGTSDGLPLSIGQGGAGIGVKRTQQLAGLTRRHAQHLWNLGHSDVRHMFWDGRVALSYKGRLLTPEKKLNGENPERSDIAKLLSGPLEAQALFPMADETEMFGPNNENLDNFAKWELISTRVFQKKEYKEKFKKIFRVDRKDFNIAYIAKALAHFQKIEFQAINAPWDRYLSGDKNALSVSQKKGALLFMTKGFCVGCHSGPLLGGVSFQNSAAPQISSLSAGDDLGRFEVSQMETQKFKFKIPALRNVALTSPYFHNGSFASLKEVVDHYNDPYNSLKDYSVFSMLDNYPSNYVSRFQEMTPGAVHQRLKRLPRFYQMNRGLMLTTEEKGQLVDFLKNALTSP